MKQEEKTHWLQSPNKNYLGHWDLPEGKDLILTIHSAKWEEVKNPIINTVEAKRVIRFKENVKPMICNQTNAQSIYKAIGVRNMEDSEGHKIQLYIANIMDKKTKENIDCIRVRKIKPIENKEELTPIHTKWDDVKNRVKEGVTKESIRKHYKISDANFDLLCG